MSTATATNGAATEAAFAAIASAFGSGSPFGSSTQDAVGAVRGAGETLVEQSRAAILRSLDIFDAAVQAYLELTRSAAATVRVADLAMGQAERYAGLAAEAAGLFSTTARDLFGK